MAGDPNDGLFLLAVDACVKSVTEMKDETLYRLMERLERWMKAHGRSYELYQLPHYGYSERTLKKAIKTLVELGIVERTFKGRWLYFHKDHWMKVRR